MTAAQPQPSFSARPVDEPQGDWHLDWIAYAGGTDVGPRAHVHLSRGGESVQAEGTGTGLIDAACHAVSQACGVSGQVMAFRAYSVGPGSEAVGEVELDVLVRSRRVTVHASSTDVVEACARAFLSAVIGGHGGPSAPSPTSGPTPDTTSGTTPSPSPGTTRSATPTTPTTPTTRTAPTTPTTGEQ